MAVKNRSPTKSAQHAYNGQSQNARCQKRPDRRMQELDGSQHEIIFDLG
jgi:hypothetical protein